MQRIALEVHEAVVLPQEAVQVARAIAQVADFAQPLQLAGNAVAQRIEPVVDAVLEFNLCIGPRSSAAGWRGFEQALHFARHPARAVPLDQRLTEHCAKLQSQLSAITTAVKALVQTDFPADTVYVPPQGGFIHWIEFPGHTDMVALEKLASERGCHVVGSNIFYPDGRTTAELRVCLGTALSPGVIESLKTLSSCAHQAGNTKNAGLAIITPPTKKSY
ncbi:MULTISPECIES: aminotransferase class I/II-fold pyridoxal phosphate-dependent enzyme [Serratia]|uniref:aminotransferase class I/II-fold pyridoxal phosphate-dependent enzyme n=1 Tax=Serratia TaxID=613 RepID=UPI000B5F4ED2|nr:MULTISPECIES: aminotransferase class I/II-fold pyridoxal phosphate-dependent enzyme [Serratia]ASM01747.1 hypothetical protein BVG88_06010 [Serratia marcescens]MBH2554010.1 aminotransferase class I/II-fold pyridoxal phosphate-dependent enzyme [Serratia ureilytica]MBH2559329.1 aminotransferase class I/II-fold pyridoxal phosphate-dependent enzyme [Serratia ureilytica]MBH2946990.1 aminotransferase class I/II-fold pyridoxal phosphate-dependent enzyme [Serratia ureilytica]PHY81651.1 hypothetical 